jgi:hypothetical protein
MERQCRGEGSLRCAQFGLQRAGKAQLHRALNVISLTLTVLGILFVLVAIAAMVVVPLVLNFIGLGGATEMIIKLARWPALLIIVTLALAFG